MSRTQRAPRKATLSDPLTLEQRRLNMSRIRGRNTRPEMVIRRGLHARGVRYRLHVKDLPGTPDMVFSRRKAVILVHGCFWHGHDCRLSVLPATNADFWAAKIARNIERDEESVTRLHAGGWRILNIWECALRGKRKLPPDALFDAAVHWLEHGAGDCDLRGSVE